MQLNLLYKVNANIGFHSVPKKIDPLLKRESLHFPYETFVKMVLSTCFSIFTLLITTCATVSSVEIVFDQMLFLNETYVKDLYNISLFRISKFNRTTYAGSSDIEMYVDVGDEFEVEMEVFYNRLNNNQYNKAPMRIPRDKVCNVIDKYLDKFIYNELRGHTNIPGDMKCPFKKVSIRTNNLQQFEFIFHIRQIIKIHTHNP